MEEAWFNFLVNWDPLLMPDKKNHKVFALIYSFLKSKCPNRNVLNNNCQIIDGDGSKHETSQFLLLPLYILK